MIDLRGQYRGPHELTFQVVVFLLTIANRVWGWHRSYDEGTNENLTRVRAKTFLVSPQTRMFDPL